MPQDGAPSSIDVLAAQVRAGFDAKWERMDAENVAAHEALAALVARVTRAEENEMYQRELHLRTRLERDDARNALEHVREILMHGECDDTYNSGGHRRRAGGNRQKIGARREPAMSGRPHAIQCPKCGSLGDAAVWFDGEYERLCCDHCLYEEWNQPVGTYPALAARLDGSSE